MWTHHPTDETAEARCSSMVELVPSNSERCVPMLRRNQPEMYDAGTFSSPRSADETIRARFRQRC